MATPEQERAFIAKIANAAQVSMLATGVPASFTVAEGALESSWGTSGLVEDAMNIFGVKADPSWTGPVFDMRTREFVNGRWIIEDAKWRKYTTWLECLNDHADFFHKNERYSSCFQYKTGAAFARAVQAAGYATDPDYADKIIEIINAHYLSALDTSPAQKQPVAPLPTAPVAAKPTPVPVKQVVTAKPIVAAPAQVPKQTGFIAWLKRLF
jgi:flagellum-specific peptidoglycan hydrolase FlgJ